MENVPLAAILNPVSEQSFFDDYLGKRPLHIVGFPEKFADLLSWADINDILEHHQFDAGRLHLWKEGKEIPQQRYAKNRPKRNRAVLFRSYLLAPRLLDELREGATLVIDEVDGLYEPITILARHLEHRFRTHVQINMYVTFRTYPGFGLHFDDHDVLVLQVFGRKRWQVFAPSSEPPRLMPIQNGSANHPFWEGSLERGASLYIPRGWWHITAPSDEPTVHLTVALSSLTGIDILNWIAERLMASEFMRRDVPRLESGEQQRGYQVILQERLSEVCSDPELLKQFWTYKNSVAEPRPVFGLPWSLTPDCLPDSDNYKIDLALPGFLETQPIPKEDAIDVLFNGQVWRYPASTNVLFKFLVDRSPVSIREFYENWAEQFGQVELRAMLSGLARRSLVILSAPGVVKTPCADVPTRCSRD